ncbi:DUF2637 domain-containing protein [Streptosporangium amethystogenes]|uniref:DUF2637 domain-containing protein n=1 Tax=Streptosporangium amethystogenes TaxID=2002 RepID=UPI00068F7A77|nr:DUF2637 domain-containing protein [Streptosporangium amethystogenes]
MIRFATTVAVVLVAGIAAVVSYQHAYALVTAHGETGLTAILAPLTVDGAIFASSMVLLDAARRGLPVPALARWTLGLGILATLAANVAHGWAHGVVGSIVAAWPALALVLSYELLMGMIRRGAESTPVQSWTPGVEVSEVEQAWRDVEELLRVAEQVEVHLPPVPPQVAASSDVNGRVVTHLTEEIVPEVEVQPETVPESDDPLYPLALSNFLGDVAEGEVPSVRTIKTRMSVGTDRARRLQAYLGRLVEVAA